MNILLVGGNGQLGWELRRTLAPLGRVVAPGRDELDLLDPASIVDCVRATTPAAVVNAAAYTDVDRAESDRQRAFDVNALGAGALARAAAAGNALLVHVSTDYVFDGRAAVPYRETAETRPVNVYGLSKRDGERAVLEAGGPSLVLRTSWLYGTRGRNFLRTILRLARTREELTVVDDQVGCPTWSRMVAEAIAAALARVANRGRFELPAGVAGVYHLAAAGSASWYEFAREILAHDPARAEHVCRVLRPVSTEEFPRPAERPAFSVLDTTRFRDTFGLRLPDWRAQLALAMDPGHEATSDAASPEPAPHARPTSH